MGWVVVMMVDECDPTVGGDDDHDYQPPCNNMVDASKEVWEALRFPEKKRGLDVQHLVWKLCCTTFGLCK